MTSEFLNPTPGLVIYLLMWILVPEEPQGTA
jgi:phage shock protein PspC (stress-responsive transcriptional regulator)